MAVLVEQIQAEAAELDLLMILPAQLDAQEALADQA
jgi:hypothetical protein